MSKKIKFHVIALQETKVKEDSTKTQVSGDMLILGCKLPNKNIGGVGFLVKKDIAPFVDSYNIFSPRLVVLRLKTPGRRDIAIYSCYAPTSAAEDEEREAFYNELESVIKQDAASFYKFVLGDFNAIFGENGSGKIRRFGLDIRVENGDRLEELLWSTGLVHKLIGQQNWSKIDDINEDYENLVRMLMELEKLCRLPPVKEERISEETKKLLKMRTHLKKTTLIPLNWNVKRLI
ncbi:hypothetical protein OESDEN_01102 [Oesophagostomum dentatum]|uniref:Endonuclease/exonuclease/phosphatase domain-containing protein n=1 Tax=Oesophagostomum dentatum TaxID=61180 RepID=A0A0B1TNR9_OESDE|nr:hypothetical protein OESDEN_01102 [Oesophagostomum dentatum]